MSKFGIPEEESFKFVKKEGNMKSFSGQKKFKINLKTCPKKRFKNYKRKILFVTTSTTTFCGVNTLICNKLVCPTSQ